MSGQVDLSVLIVTYNCADLAIQCVESVRRYTEGVGYEILVHDNASTCKERLQELEALGAEVAYGGENLGFGQANNILARKARGSHLVFLNPDTLVMDDVLSALVEHLKAYPSAGAVAPLLINTDGSLQHSWNLPIGLLWEFCETHYLQNIFRDRAAEEMRRRQAVGPWPVGFASGACLCLRREEFVDIGGFDRDFFLNHEDIELCDRLRAAGRQVHVLPGLRLVHLDGGTQKADWRRFTRDRMTAKWIYLRKRFSGWRLLVARALWFEEIALKLVVGSLLLRGSDRTRLPGFLDALRQVALG